MDKVQKIREEVEKLKSQLLRGACSSQIAMETRCKEEAYNEVLAILDTMQEEPVKRTPADIEASMQEVEDKSRAFTEAHKGEDADTILAQMRGEEPVSEELEEASKNYALNNTPWDDCKDEIQESFKAGAKWQKAKDESTTEDLGDYINKLSKQFPEVSFAKLSRIAVRVAKWQKQQIEKAMDLGEPPYLISVEQAYYRTLNLLEE